MSVAKKADQFVMRFPDGLRSRIKLVAKENMRSMNSEIIFQLERIYQEGNTETKKADVQA